MEQNEREISARSLRRCAVSKLEKSKSDMVRFVVSDDGEVFPDVSARAPGRGVWISSDLESLTLAIKVNAFSRSLKRQCYPKTELIEQTQTALFQKSLGMLGLARRAGQLIMGFDNVTQSIRNQAPAFVIEASDGANDGRDKIMGLIKKWEDVQIIGCFCVDDLGKVLSRDNVIHALMPKGQFAQNWALELKRLEGFMPLRPNEWVF